MSDARRRLAGIVRTAIPSASDALVNAFATVPRERFLPRGPWQIRDATGIRVTDDDNPARVYEDASIAVDAARDLYNGQPSTVARWFDALAIAEGDHVLHIGGGSGYYSAILAETVGPRGRVTTVEIDHALAAAAATNLEPWPWTKVRQGDGLSGLPSDIDVVVVHAGASHVTSAWLSCGRHSARLLVPITVEFAAMGPTLGKGLTFVLRRAGDGWAAKALSFAAIYSMQYARDAEKAATFGEAMQRRGWDRVTRLRVDPHPPEASCWCHWGDACLSGPDGAS